MSRWFTPGIFAALAFSTAAQAVHKALALIDHPGTRPALIALYALLRTAVAVAFAAFTVERAEPVKRSRDPLAFIACALAMIAIAIVAPPPHEAAAAPLVIGDALAVGSCAWILGSVLVLGRCFGVLPEARGLVLRGPYRIVRHPVYLGEIGALTGLTIAAPAIRNVVVLALFVAVQVIRTRMEERALTEAFPHYAQYTAQTGRLLPRMRLTGTTTRRIAMTTRGAK